VAIILVTTELEFENIEKINFLIPSFYYKNTYLGGGCDFFLLLLLKNGAFPVTEFFPMLMCWHVKYAFALIIMKLRGIRLEKNKIKNNFFF
jgi:hypothetical protein